MMNDVQTLNEWLSKQKVKVKVIDFDYPPLSAEAAEKYCWDISMDDVFAASTKLQKDVGRA